MSQWYAEGKALRKTTEDTKPTVINRITSHIALEDVESLYDLGGDWWQKQPSKNASLRVFHTVCRQIAGSEVERMPVHAVSELGNQLAEACAVIDDVCRADDNAPSGHQDAHESASKLSNAVSRLLKESAPIVAYSSAQGTDAALSGLAESMGDRVKAIEDLGARATEKMSKAEKGFEKLRKDVETVLPDAGVGAYADEFSRVAREHNEAARCWLVATLRVAGAHRRCRLEGVRHTSLA